MAISPDHQRITDLLVKDIEGSNLTADEKNNLVTSLQGALASTNGLTQEEKLQSVCVSNFWGAVNLAKIQLAVLKGGKEVQSWKTVIVRCANQILAAIGILAVLFLFRPEVASVISAFAK